ncbi:MAG: TetR/AcrR family transcriptional regulator [Acidimicrobiia bacterium]|nr:MAG: TetR/AcrR family transcriptional regulator [Acidimicrobiia bacterium]
MGSISDRPAPTGSPNWPRVDAILAGAARAFAAHGYAATSMRQVAQYTGASLGSIYHHFGSKEGLLQAILTTNFRRVRAALEERLTEITDPAEAITAFVENHVAFFTRDLDAMKVMSHELSTLRGTAGEEVRALRDAYTERARGFLRRLRPDLGRDEAEVATLCFFGMLNWTYRWVHSLPSTTTPAELAGQMARLFLDGFAGTVTARRSPGG